MGEVVVNRAGWIVAVWTLSLYWSGYDVLKDVLVWFCMSLAVLALAARNWRSNSLLGAVSASGAYLVRNYMGPVLGMLLIVGALLRRDWRRLGATFGALVVVQAAIIAAGFPPMWSFASPSGSIPVIEEGTGAGTTVSLKDPIVIAKRLVVDTPIEVLGPRFALQDIRRPTLDTGMYPGLVVWIVLIPSTALGLWRAFRKRDSTLWSIEILVLSLWATLVVLYAGLGFRQREMVFPATLLFTSIGLERPWPRFWWWANAAVFALGLGALVAREAGLIPRLA